MSVSKYLIHRKTGNVVVSNDGFAGSGDYRRMTKAELEQRGFLAHEDEAQVIAGEHIVLADHFGDLSKADLNLFVVENGLASSLNTASPQLELVKLVKGLVRRHNRELLKSTEETFLPEGFFNMTTKTLREISKEEEFDIDLSGLKIDIQDRLYAAFYTRSQEPEE
jgi:hypothetical protein